MEMAGISYLVEFLLHQSISLLDVVARNAMNVVRGSDSHVVEIVSQQLDPFGELDRRKRERLEIFARRVEIFLELFFSILKILLQLLLSVVNVFFVLVVTLFGSFENSCVGQLMRLLERTGPEVIDRQRNEIVLEQAPPAEVHGHQGEEQADKCVDQNHVHCSSLVQIQMRTDLSLGPLP